jgi:serine/threonine protein kinase
MRSRAGDPRPRTRTTLSQIVVARRDVVRLDRDGVIRCTRMAPDASRSPFVPFRVGRYALHGELASGGMATVHFGRLLGPAGFSRTVAVKRLHAHLAKDPEFVSMFLDEARLAARVRHPNVVPTLDVVAVEDELFLVMDYVPGESLARLIKAARVDDAIMPLPIVSAIVAGALHGLHAAHEATNERGEPLDLVHRDVSPQNVLVGVDGIARVLDFGIAKAAGRLHTTRDGRLKGKLAYMAPEQLRQGIVDRRTDIYAAGVILWELLTDQRLHEASTEAEMLTRVLEARIEPPSTRRADVPRALDEITMRALAKNPSERFGTARQMARAIEACVPSAGAGEVGEWVERIAMDALDQRARIVASIETSDVGPSKVAPRETKRSRVGIAFVAGLSVAGLAVLGVRAFGRVEAAPAAVRDEPSGSVSASAKSSPVSSASATPPPSATEASSLASPPPPKAKTLASTTTSKQGIVHPAPLPRPAPNVATPACTVKSYVDGAGVKHYVNDCPKKP